ncbi:DEAD/DEAH box helicase [Clostridia bacterium]|nr:DEAD/DEAH box helicase [Clostridia bacterium]
MRFEPHEYQRFAIAFLEQHPIAALFLECGLGKTVITLTALHTLILDSFEVKRALVIAPLRVARDVWPDEIQKWDHLSGLTYAVAIGTALERKAALAQNAMVTIINRENVQWLIQSNPFNFDMVIIDELSSFKSNQAKRFKALIKARPYARRIVGLTGSPAANGLMNLWAEFRLLDMGERLGRYITRYRDKYFTPDKRNGMQVFSYKLRPGEEDEIYRLIGDITVSMKSIDHLRMPELISNTVLVHLSSEEDKQYQTLKRELVLSLGENEIDAVNAAALSNKLLQMANGAVYDDERRVVHIHDRKLDALEDLIEAANGKPVLVSYWFKHDIAQIKKRFSIEPLDSADSIIRWNAGDIPLAAIHPASAGFGLNLQAGGSTLIWYSMTWSLELYQQTNARLWRQGQRDAVVIHHIVAKGTIDEHVMAALQKKDITQSALIDAVKAQMEAV